MAGSQCLLPKRSIHFSEVYGYLYGKLTASLFLHNSNSGEERELATELLASGYSGDSVRGIEEISST